MQSTTHGTATARPARAGRSTLAAVAAVAAALAAATALAGAGAAAADTIPTERVLLRPLAQSGVSGSAVVGARGEGTRVVLALRGLEAGAKVRALLLAGTCRKPSASFAEIAAGKATAAGRYAVTGSVRYRGEPVGITTTMDGGHLVMIVAGGKQVACGVIPGMS